MTVISERVRGGGALPPGWRRQSLASIGPLADGDWILTSDYAPTGVRLHQVGDVGVGRFIPKSSRYITQARANELGCTMLRAGDVLISRMPDPIGRACLLPDIGYPAITAVDVSIWRPRPEVADPRFVTYYLNCKEWFTEVLARASGATRARISRSNLEQLIIPLPPVAEQQRIAAILDEQTVAIERARAAAAQQLEAARALPAAYLRSVFESDEAKVWPMIRLGDALILRKDVVHPYNNPKGPAIFVGLEHIESHTGLRTGSVEIEMSSLRGRKPQFSSGDIVYGYLRPYLNKVWLADFDGLCSVDQYVFTVRLDKALPDFIAWFMRSPTYLTRAPIDTTPGQLPRIRTEEVFSVELGLPSLAEQQRVASRLAGTAATTASAVASAQHCVQALDLLQSAILREAFAGRLSVPAKQAIVPRRLPKGIYFKRGAIASYIIQRLHNQPTFGRVQFEKVLYLTETHIGLDLAGTYRREAAGPLDADSLNKVESLGAKQRWFTRHRRKSGGYFYRPGANIAGRVMAAGTILGVRRAAMDHLLQLFEELNTERAEVVATLFAAWNDFLIDGVSPSDAQIVEEVRQRWHASKARFTDMTLGRSLEWIRKNDLVPRGVGPRTVASNG